MGRRLATAVHVQHPASREWIVLDPGDEPDEELAAEITNPDAWEDHETAPDEEEQEPEEPKPFGFTALPEAEATPPAPSRGRKTTDAAE
ncbi:hypothetical protein ACF09H_08750 [Streptomyces sp. NPDC014983]|uniref:hypothetical protein n=1 Tax=Streptomyces sp. NPDC014983 TaxID=3364933 RepID=UPI0036F5604F